MPDHSRRLGLKYLPQARQARRVGPGFGLQSSDLQRRFEFLELWIEQRVLVTHSLLQLNIGISSSKYNFVIWSSAFHWNWKDLLLSAQLLE